MMSEKRDMGDAASSEDDDELLFGRLPTKTVSKSHVVCEKGDEAPPPPLKRSRLNSEEMPTTSRGKKGWVTSRNLVETTAYNSPGKPEQNESEEASLNPTELSEVSGNLIMLSELMDEMSSSEETCNPKTPSRNGSKQTSEQDSTMLQSEGDVVIISSADDHLEREDLFSNFLKEGKDPVSESNRYADFRHVLSGQRERTLIDLCGEESRFVDDNIRPHGEQDDVCVQDSDDFYGLGLEVKKAVYATFTISKLHTWQHDMLKCQIEQDNKNSLVLAPTGGGKTIVAFILLLRTLLVHKQDAIISLPYVALVEEKCKELRTLACRLSTASSTSFDVQEYAGAKGRLPVPARKNDIRCVFVCTVEKASLIWRQFARDRIPDDRMTYRTGLVVLDEFHMIGDGNRGAVLEQLLTSILFWAGTTTRVLGMSATIGNPERLAELLGGGNMDNCNMYQVARRPTVQIKEHVVVLGGSFPIQRNIETGLGTINFEASEDHEVGFDILSNNDRLRGTSIQRENPQNLWLKIHQYRLHLQKTSLFKLPHRAGSVGLRFPPVTRIPDYVTKYCQGLVESPNQVALSESGLSREIVMSINQAREHAIAQLQQGNGDHYDSEDDRMQTVAAEFWRGRCAELISDVVDPYARHRSTSDMEKDARDWDSRITANLVLDAMQRDGSVLVFCGVRAECVAVCDYLTRACKAVLAAADDTQVRLPATPDIISKERQNIIDHLREESSNLVDDVLIRGIRFGIAYHTAALSAMERRVLESAFSRKILSTLVCTTTLAAGITLPAERIIIRSPFIAGQFTTCTRYLQMVGRAGRTCKTTTTTTTTPDSYVIVSPKNIAQFQKLVDLHVEPVHSSLTSSDTYYTRVHGTSPRNTSSCYTGVTRVVITFIESSKLMPLSQLLEAYRLTLLYQLGDKIDHNDEDIEENCSKGQQIKTVRHVLKELQALIERDFIHIRLMVPSGEQGTLKDLEKTGQTNKLPTELRDRQPWGSTVDDEVLSRLRTADEAECKELIALLETAAAEEGPQDCVDLPDVLLSTTTFTSAAVAGALSLQDAETFVAEASQMEKTLSLSDPLGILYLTISSDIARPFPEHIKMLVNREILSNFNGHCNKTFFESIGIGERELDLWLRGNTRVGKSESFYTSLQRMWTALFAKETSMKPEMFDQLCQRFGFSRGDAMELASTVASRFANIKNFCSTAGKFWWYAPLSTATAVLMSDSCDEELRPLINIRHMTKSRARALYKLGCRSTKDVAALQPDVAAQGVRFLGKWRAVEMIIDARMKLAQELVQNAAESQIKMKALQMM